MLRAPQINPFGRGNEPVLATRLADQIGGSACVLSDPIHHSARIVLAYGPARRG